MDSTLIIPLPRSIKNPSPFAPVAPSRPLYYDDFSGPDTTSIAGRATVAEEGYAVGTWQATPEAYATANGRLVRGTNTATAFAGLQGSDGAQEITIFLERHADPGQAMYLDLYRQTVGGTPDSYRLRLQDYKGVFTKRVGGVHTTVGVEFGVPNMSAVSLRHGGTDGWLTAVVNGKPMAKLQIDEIPRTGMAGIAMGGGVTGFQIETARIGMF